LLVEAALDADFEATRCSTPSADNFLGVDTATAIEAGYGDLPEECDLSGEESAYSTEKAAEMLGWEPEHSWKTAEDEEVAGPSFV